MRNNNAFLIRLMNPTSIVPDQSVTKNSVY